MSAVPDPIRSVECIDTWIARHHPDRLPFVRPGAELVTLRRIEARLGQALPPDIRRLYALHDGQPEGAPTLYLNQRWLPLDLVAVAWEDLCLRHGTGGKVPQAAVSGGWPLPQTRTWSASWLPVFGSPQGDHYCVDLRPDRYGQILWFLFDRPERTVLAPSMGALLWRVAKGLDIGKWRLDYGSDGLSD